MSDFEVRPDEFFPIGFEGTEEGVMVSAKYDRMDYFPALGAWILKCYDDDTGLMSLYIEEETARRVVDHTDIPVVQRDWMYQSEHNAYMISREKLEAEEYEEQIDVAVLSQEVLARAIETVAVEVDSSDIDHYWDFIEGTNE